MIKNTHKVDNTINKLEKEIKLARLRWTILRKHLDEIRDVQSLMQETLNALNEIEESKVVSHIIHYSSKNKEFSNLPSKVNVSIPKFFKTTGKK